MTMKAGIWIDHRKAVIVTMDAGETKGDLRKRFQMKGLDARVAAVQTEDKMTDGQFAAKTHQYFADSAHCAS